MTLPATHYETARYKATRRTYGESSHIVDKQTGERIAIYYRATGSLMLVNGNEIAPGEVLGFLYYVKRALLIERIDKNSPLIKPNIKHEDRI